MISLLRHLGSSSKKQQRHRSRDEEEEEMASSDYEVLSPAEAGESTRTSHSHNAMMVDADDEDMTLSVEVAEAAASPNFHVESGQPLLTALSSPLVDTPPHHDTSTSSRTRTTVASLPPTNHHLPESSLMGQTSTSSVAAAAASAKTGENDKDDNDLLSHHDLWKMVDRELRTNMGNSVRCGICLCTLTNPIMTPCVHAFCQRCLTTALLRRDKDGKNNNPKCPECNQPITKRACQPYPFMNDLAKVYKELLQDFGLTPSERDPTFTTLTQAVPSSEEEDEEEDSSQGKDDRDEKYKTEMERKKRIRLERSQVSKTWQQTLEQVGDVEPIFKMENAKVVAANERALLRKGPQQWQQQQPKEVVGVPPRALAASQCGDATVAVTTADRKTLLLTTPGQGPSSQRPPYHPQQRPPSTQPRRRTTGTAITTTTPVPSSAASKSSARRLYGSTPSPGGAAFPNTQEIIEQAQEQQAADRSAEWLEEDEEEVEDQQAEPERTPRTSTSFLFPNSNSDFGEEGPGSNVSNPPSPTPTFGTAREEEESQEALSKLQQQQQQQSQVYGTPADFPSQTTTDLDPLPPQQPPSPVQEEPKEDANKDKEEETAELSSSPLDVKPPAKIWNKDGPEQTQLGTAKPVTSTTKESESSGKQMAASETGITNEHTARAVSSTEAATPKASSNISTYLTKTTITKSAMVTSQRHKLPIPQEEDPSPPEDSSSRQDLVSSPPPHCAAAASGGGSGASEASSPTGPIVVGTIVDVQPRTWPGVNKLGGIARITKVHDNGSSYNVRYILGGRETDVDAVFVRRQDDGHQSQRKRKSASQTVDTSTGTLAAAATTTAVVAAFTEELPAELLAALADEGFDTGVRPAAKKKRKAPAATATDNSSKQRSQSLDATRTKRNSGSGSGTAAKKPSAAAATTASRRRSAATTTTATTTTTTKSNRRRPLQNVANQSSTDNKRKKATTGKKSSTTTTTKRKSSKSAPATATAAAIKDTSSTSTTKTPASTAPAGTTTGCTEDLFRHADDQICKLADARYAKHVEAAIRDAKVVSVVASNLEERDMDVLRALCRKSHRSHADEPVKFKLVESFSAKTTLCITHAESKDKKDKGNQSARIRSLKSMRSALAGIPIVSPDYVHMCLEKDAILPPTPSMMIRSLPTKTQSLESTGAAAYGVAALAATMDQSTTSEEGGGEYLFSNMSVLLCGAFSAAKRTDIHLLLKEGGAKLLPNPAAAVAELKLLSSSTAGPSSKSDKVVLLCDDSSSSSSMNVIPVVLDRQAKFHSEASLMVVNSSWLFDSITCGRPLDARTFPPSAFKAKELWSRLVVETCT